ncbi:hypothetical protein ACFSQ3_04150 [Sphingobacterium corticis]|uniref:RDD family protein n=1 Tax=Sphingobacterium corticis TaxID=1812823 RepID=A0ABW5NHH9_9SPHI
MDELDFLKNQWQKEDRFPQIKAQEIRSMLHRSSSSIVQWIFVISILEFLFGLLMSFVLPDLEFRSAFEEYFVLAVEGVFYVVIFYFIYHFFKSFRAIRSTKDAKSLISSIIVTREHVERYVKFNIYFFGFSIVTAGLFSLHEKIFASDVERRTMDIVFYVAIFIALIAIIGWLFIFLVRLYYRVLYGILLKRLNKNYEELLQLEKEVE